VIEGDIRNAEIVAKSVKGVDVVLHMAALIEVPFSIENPATTHTINVNGTINILESCRRFDVKEIVYPSSNLTYGEPIYTPIDENHPQNPVSPYAASKCAAEKYCFAYNRTYGLPITVLRFSNLYGPRGLGVINIFVRNAIQGKPLEIHGGRQVRTFTHIFDAIEATQLCLESRTAIGEIFNIAGPESTSISEIANIVREEIGNVELKRIETRVGDVTSSQYGISIEKARNLLGYEPKYDIRKGVRQLVAFEKKNLDS